MKNEDIVLNSLITIKNDLRKKVKDEEKLWSFFRRKIIRSFSIRKISIYVEECEKYFPNFLNLSIKHQELPKNARAEIDQAFNRASREYEFFKTPKNELTEIVRYIQLFEKWRDDINIIREEFEATSYNLDEIEEIIRNNGLLKYFAIEIDSYEEWRNFEYFIDLFGTIGLLNFKSNQIEKFTNFGLQENDLLPGRFSSKILQLLNSIYIADITKEHLRYTDKHDDYENHYLPIYREIKQLGETIKKEITSRDAKEIDRIDKEKLKEKIEDLKNNCTEFNKFVRYPLGEFHQPDFLRMLENIKQDVKELLILLGNSKI